MLLSPPHMVSWIHFPLMNVTYKSLCLSKAAILNPNPPVYTFTEKDWNTYSIAQVEEKGDACDGFSQ